MMVNTKKTKEELLEIEDENSMSEARSFVLKYYEQYISKTTSVETNEKADDFIFLFYKQIGKVIKGDSYDQFLKYCRTTQGIYGKIIKELKRNLESNCAFNMGRIIGATQVSYRIADELYTEKIGAEVLDKVLEGKDLKRILFICKVEGKAYNKELCDELDVKPNNLNKKMGILMDLDLVKRHQIGKRVYYTLSESGEKVAIRIGSPKTELCNKIQYEEFKLKNKTNIYLKYRDTPDVHYHITINDDVKKIFMEKAYE